MFSGVILTFSGNSCGAISFLYWGGKQILIYTSQCKIQSSAGHHIAQCKHCFELHILLLSAVSQVNGLLPVSLHFKTCSHWHRIWAKISPWFLICDLPQGPYKAGCSIHSALTRYNSNILAWHFCRCYCMLHEDNVLAAIFSLWKELRAATSWEDIENLVWGELNRYQESCTP